jgi:hypothetical protein
MFPNVAGEKRSRSSSHEEERVGAGENLSGARAISSKEEEVLRGREIMFSRMQN